MNFQRQTQVRCSEHGDRLLFGFPLDGREIIDYHWIRYATHSPIPVSQEHGADEYDAHEIKTPSALNLHSRSRAGCDLLAVMARYAIFDALDLTRSLTQVICQPCIERGEPLVDVLSQRLVTEFDADITKPISNTLSPLRPHSVACEGPRRGCNFVHQGHSFFRLLVSRFLDPTTTYSLTERMKSSFLDTGKDRACAVDVEEPRNATPKSYSDDEALAGYGGFEVCPYSAISRRGWFLWIFTFVHLSFLTSCTRKKIVSDRACDCPLLRLTHPGYPGTATE